MINIRTVAACAFALAILEEPVYAQDLSRYRAFALGADAAAVSTATGLPASEFKIVYQRPAVVQTLDWRPSRWVSGSTAESTDPVERIGFSFYNDHLFQIVVDYDHDRTEGMSDGDMNEAISAIYGATVKPSRVSGRAQSDVEMESGTPVGRWTDAKRAVVLYRTSSYQHAYRLIVTDVGLAGRARTNATESLRLDEQDAPRREIARLKKERDDARAAAEKARLANKGQFIP